MLIITDGMTNYHTGPNRTASATDVTPVPDQPH